MAVLVNANEVYLNATKFKVTGSVNQYIASNLPEKTVIGDYTADSNPLLSTWTLKDLTGGALVEEMDVTKHANRFWWSTMWTRTKGRILPTPGFSAATIATTPAAPTMLNGNMDAWSESVPGGGYDLLDNWTIDNSGTVSVTRGGSASDYYPLFTVSTTPGEYASIYQDNAGYATYKGLYIWVQVSVYYQTGSDSNLTAQIIINDGVDTTTYEPGTATGWKTYIVRHLVNANATRLRVTFKALALAGAGDTMRVNDASFVASTGTTRQFVEFNDNLYLYVGNTLYKLSGTTFTTMARVPAAITRAIPSISSSLYLYQGDSNNYWVMNTSEVLTDGGSSGAYYGIQWDNKLFKFSSTGTGYYSTNPAAASPTWSTCGNLTDVSAADLAGRHPKIYQDADGNDIIYWATRKGLKAMDFSTPQWVDTKVSYPAHDNAGVGTEFWRGSLYIPVGLDVLKYTVGTPATIENVGLSQDDGLPSEYNGNIMKLYGSYGEMYAFVDSTQVSGSSTTSSLWMYDEVGWHILSVDTATEKTFYDMIVSSVGAYRLWRWNENTGLRYLTLSKGITNPSQAPTWTTWSTGSALYSPWFDAAWVSGNKLAVKADLFVYLQSGEQLAVAYRLNHSSNTIASGWTSLGTITTSGANTLYFGSYAGITFKAIQFRFIYSTSVGYTSPFTLYDFTLSYQKLNTPTWGWTFTLDCSKEYDGKSGEQQVTALEAAAVTETLVPFVLKDTTYYVRVKDVRSAQLTGETDKGLYNVTVVEPV